MIRVGVLLILALLSAPALATIFSVPPIVVTPVTPSTITVLGYSTPTIDESQTDTTTVTYDVDASADFIAVSVTGLGAYGGATPFAISGVTWNGVSVTQAVTTFGEFVAGPTYRQITQVYYLNAPDTGSHNLVVTNNTNGSDIGAIFVNVQIIAMSGVKTSSPLDTSGSANTPGSDTVNINTTSTTSGVRVGARAVLSSGGGSSYTAGGGIVETEDENDSGNAVGFFTGYALTPSTGLFGFSTDYGTGSDGLIDTAVVAVFKAQ